MFMLILSLYAIKSSKISPLITKLHHLRFPLLGHAKLKGDGRSRFSASSRAQGGSLMHQAKACF